MKTFATFQQLKKKLRRRAFGSSPARKSTKSGSCIFSHEDLTRSDKDAVDIPTSDECTKNALVEESKENKCNNENIPTPRSNSFDSTPNPKRNSRIAGEDSESADTNACGNLATDPDFSTVHVKVGEKPTIAGKHYLTGESNTNEERIGRNAADKMGQKDGEKIHEWLCGPDPRSKSRRIDIFRPILEPASVHTDFLHQGNRKMNGFDKTVRISDNPFDILENNQFRAVPILTQEELQHTSRASDDLLLSVLKRPKKTCLESKPSRKEGIFRKLTIYSRSDLVIQTKKYYKFPFEMQLLNDESTIFSSVRNVFVSALSSVYSNYRRFGESFKVLANEGLFIFGKDVTCSKSLSKMLRGFDIDFSEAGDRIVINPNDKGMVCDVIMNLEIPRGKPLPFILSEFEFEDGIVYRTKLGKGPAVRNGNKIEYTYYVGGPLYSPDVKVDDDAQIDYVE